MSFKLYNRHFKIGVGIAAGAFVIPNIVSYVAASRHAEEIERIGISFSGNVGFDWGWPYFWGDWEGFVNLALLLFSSLFFGLFFRWIVGVVERKEPAR